MTWPTFSRRLIGILTSACLVSGALAQSTYYVNGSCGSDSWSGTSLVCAFPNGPKRTIQGGIDTSTTGDTVIVADGTYTGFGNRDLDFGGRDIHLRSESLDPALCIIDCQGTTRAFHFHSGETTAAIIEGFTVTNGFVVGGGGGAILCESSGVTIRNCMLLGNSARSDANVGADGGAINALSATIVMTDCDLIDNQALVSAQRNSNGGAINGFDSTLTLIGCVIRNNSAYLGGGIRLFGSSTLTDCLVTDNTAFGSFGHAGGLALWGSGPHELRRCTIARNQAGSWGGGARIVNGLVVDCLIADNTSGGQAGGIRGDGILRDCTIRDNTGVGMGGGALWVGSVENCTIIGNRCLPNQFGVAQSGGIGATSVSDSLIAFNSASGQFSLGGGGGVGRIENCVVIGNSAGELGGGLIVGGTAVNCLVAGNTAASAAGIAARVRG